MSLRALLFVGFAVASGVGPASLAWADDDEAPSYTMADVKACSKDALRLCRDKLAHIGQIEACMRSKISELSPKCQERFKNH